MESRDKSVRDVPRNAREFPSNKLVMDSSPRAIRESGKFEFIVGRLLKEFPGDVGLVFMRREKSLKGFKLKDAKEIAAFLVPVDVLGENKMLPRFPKVSGASGLSKEGRDLGRPSFCLVVFKVGDSHRGSGRNEIDASELEVEMKPTFEIVKVFRSNPLTRTRRKDAVGSGFSGKNLKRGRDELPEKAQDREAEDVVKSTFVFEANIELAPRSASADKLLVSILPSRVGGFRTGDEA